MGGAEQKRTWIGRVPAWGCVVGLLCLTACGSSSSSTATTVTTTTRATSTTGGSSTTAAAPTTMAATSTTAAPMKTTYPVTVEDCDGRKTTYAKAPERVVTIDPSITEMLLVLGLKDRIVGFTQFFTKDQEWAPVKAEMDSLKVINGADLSYPSKEAVVAANPDLVASVYSYAFADPLPDRKGWTALGINSYEAFGGCTSTAPTDFSVLYKDLRNLGVIFDVQDRAEAEVTKLESQVTALQQKVKDAGIGAKSIAAYDGYDKSPTFYGGIENAVISLAGASYIWAKQDPSTSPSWEAFVKADPQVIWIVPDAGPTVADLEKRLENDPRFVNVAGVKNKAFVVVPQNNATIESPRIIDGLTAMVDGLTALK